MARKSHKRQLSSRKPRFMVGRLRRIKKMLFSGQGYIGFIILLMVILGVVLAGGISTFKNTQTPLQGTIFDDHPSPGQHETLQLKTLTIVTVTPTVPPVAVQPALCTNTQVNDEVGIVAGYTPGQGQSVGATGQVKVWISDEHPPCVGTGETIDGSGNILVRGNTTEQAPDGYLWEPALYIAPSLAENGGTPHFVDAIKGTFNNATKPVGGKCDSNTNQVTGPAMDPIPAGFPAPGEIDFQDEYIWNVSGLGLTPGNTYQAEFVIHDGDDNRGVSCVNISI